MIVLAILAVLGAVAVPGFGARAARARLHATAEQLAADVSQARFEAARRGLPLVLQASPGSGWCWAIVTTAGCPCGQRQACEISHVAAADQPGVTLADALDLRFNPDGSAVARAAVRLTSSSVADRLRVEVSPQGRPRVCSESGATATLPAC